MKSMGIGKFGFYVLAICAVFVAISAFVGTQETMAANVITASSGDNGQITPSKRTVREGRNAIFTVKPSKGFVIAVITVDGEDIGFSQVRKPWKPYKYIFKKVIDTHTINATFKPDVKISPPFAILEVGSEKVFSVTNSRGKKLSNVTAHWSTNDPNIATATDAGRVAAKAEGTTDVIIQGEMVVENMVPVIFDPLNIKVVGPIQRPSEIVSISPSENVTIGFGHCTVQGVSSNCGVTVSAISATFHFDNDDLLNSAQLFLDGIDVTANSEISTTTYSKEDGGSFVESRIFYSISDASLADGLHEVDVNGTSKAGKTVRYSWSFAKM